MTFSSFRRAHESAAHSAPAGLDASSIRRVGAPTPMGRTRNLASGRAPAAAGSKGANPSPGAGSVAAALAELRTLRARVMRELAARGVRDKAVIDDVYLERFWLLPERTVRLLLEEVARRSARRRRIEVYAGRSACADSEPER